MAKYLYINPSASAWGLIVSPGHWSNLPSTDQPNESKASRALQQRQNMSRARGSRRGGVCGCDEGEEHGEAEEEKHEEGVYAERADHEDEGDHAHCDVVEDLGGFVGCACGSAEAFGGGEGGGDLVDWILVVGEGAPVRAVNYEDGEGEG